MVGIEVVAYQRQGACLLIQINTFLIPNISRDSSSYNISSIGAKCKICHVCTLKQILSTTNQHNIVYVSGIDASNYNILA
jgi:hypothetical protein